VAEMYFPLLPCPSPIQACQHHLTKTRDDGTTLTLSEFRVFLNEQREIISNRQLVGQSFVVAPADPLGWTGSVTYTHTFSGVKDGRTLWGL
jgi:hypothetical protein